MKGPEEHGENERLYSDTNKRKLEENIQLAKQKAQEIVAKLVSNAESKRPRFDSEPPTPAPVVQNSSLSGGSFPGTYQGFQSTSKKVNIPNIKVGLIIGKGGETIKYLQLQSGAKIQITRDSEADPHSMTRDVELVGTSEQVSRAEQLINDVISEADSGGSASSANQGMNSVTPGVEQFVMKIPNNKVAFLIGKGGETIKSIQSKSAARVQVIPLHLPPGDTSTERSVYINGLKEQIESAKELINEVLNTRRNSNTSGTTSFMQTNFASPGNWAQTGQYPSQQQQQPQYGYGQGAYPTPGPTYYTNYPTQVTSWDPSSQSTVLPPEQNAGYNYYGQQAQIGSAPPPDPSYSYASTGTHGYDQNYSQQAPPDYGQHYSGQILPYDQQKSYLDSGNGPPAVPSETNGTPTEPSTAYQHSNSQPTANPTVGYWTYPVDSTQSFPQTGNDQSGYYQSGHGGQEQAHVAPQPVYAQGGYPFAPPPVYSQAPPAPVPPQLEVRNQSQPPSVGGIERSGEGNSNGDQGSAPSA